MRKSRTGMLDFRDLPASYAALVRRHVPRPLHDDVDLANATEILDAMAGHDLNQDQQDYLDLLSTLVADYEDKQNPMLTRRMSPLGALRFLLLENDLNASDLGRILGHRELGSKILRGERRLNLDQIRRISTRFSVSPSVFV